VQVVEDRIAQCAVEFSVHVGVLEEFPGGNAGEKIGLGKEMIILAVNLAGARRTCRARDGINEVGRLAKRVTECRFPGA
jgi:hypothetical protein